MYKHSNSGHALVHGGEDGGEGVVVLVVHTKLLARLPGMDFGIEGKGKGAC
jgi:hypothetical protein